MNHFHTLPMKKCTRRQQRRRVAEASAQFNSEPKLSQKKLRKLELAAKRGQPRRTLHRGFEEAEELNDTPGIERARRASQMVLGRPTKKTSTMAMLAALGVRKPKPQRQKAFGREQRTPVEQEENS